MQTKSLIDALQAFIDACPQDGTYCDFCDQQLKPTGVFILGYQVGEVTGHAADCIYSNGIKALEGMRVMA